MKNSKKLGGVFLVFFFTVFAFFPCIRKDLTHNVSSVLAAAEMYHDVKVTLTWNSVYCNMGLYVKEPTGETASWLNPMTSIGGEVGYYDYDTVNQDWVFGDSGEGVGRETYRLEEGREGEYEVSVNSPGLAEGGTARVEVFVIMNELTYKEQCIALFSQEVNLVGERTWQVGRFSYYPLPGSSDCFISTAAYGTPSAGEVRILCLFRDRYLIRNRSGRALIKLYEALSPPISRVVAGNKWLRQVVRMQLAPLVALSRFILGSP